MKSIKINNLNIDKITFIITLYGYSCKRLLKNEHNKIVHQGDNDFTMFGSITFAIAFAYIIGCIVLNLKAADVKRKKLKKNRVSLALFGK